MQADHETRGVEVVETGDPDEHGRQADEPPPTPRAIEESKTASLHLALFCRTSGA